MVAYDFLARVGPKGLLHDFRDRDALDERFGDIGRPNFEGRERFGDTGRPNFEGGARFRNV